MAERKKNEAAVELGRRGGLKNKGQKSEARAAAARRNLEIARAKRWPKDES